MTLPIIPHIHNELELKAFLDTFEEDLRARQEVLSKLHFKHLVEKCIIPELAELQKENSKIVTDPKFVEVIQTWADRATDPTLAHRLALWKRGFIKNKVSRHPEVMQLTRELSDELVTHQYTVAGQKSDLGTIKNILRTSPDAKLREAAWYGKHAISETLAPRLKQLVTLRNDLAIELGYTSFVDLMLEQDGLSFNEVWTMLHDLNKASKPVYQQILADGQELLGLDTVKPWDLMYLLEEMGGVDPSLFPKTKIEAKMREWAKAHGTDLQKLGIQVVCTDIPYNGLCMTLTDQDIRILSNPSDGHGSYRTLFHEMGHALHSAYNRPEARTFRQDSGPFTEGMAELIAYVTRHADWLKDMGLGADEIRTVQRRLIAPMFHYLRERSAYALTEFIIYEDPRSNADYLLGKVEEDVLGVVDVKAPRWAANAWYINYPVYWQNYVLADMVASQIHARLNQQYGSLHGQPAAFAEVVKTYFAPGSSIDWQDKLLNHTGSKLKADALVQDLQIYLEK